MNSEGDIISTGCNDVPKAGGGLYSTEMGDNDLRCMNRYNGQCWAVFHKDIIRDQIEKLLRRELGDNDKSHEIAELISKNTRLKNILEFSRSVHAEMDAIVSVARNGKASLKGCTLFCTTFPCHNCARHIIASGIMEVYYIEPYEKSLAWDLHDDSMVLEPTENDKPNNKVVFSHFEGVAPRKYLELFRYVDEKKEGGKMVRAPRRDHLPRIAKYLDPFPDYESRVVHHLTEIGLIKGEGDDNGEQK